MKKDIADRRDLDFLLKAFYTRLLQDNSINYIFTDVMKVNLDTHLPIITDFWESILFDRNIYKNNPMKIHLEMHHQTPLLKNHFDTWLLYFNSTIDQFFDGPIAARAKERALSIATVMQIKIGQER